MPPVIAEEKNREELPAEERKEETPAPPETAPPADEPEDAPEDRRPRRSETDYDDLLDPENGLIVGKFKTPVEAIRAYKSAESALGKKSGELAEYCRAMEAAGWTFEDGKPVAPPVTATPEPAARQQEQAREPELLPEQRTYVGTDGVTYDYLGMPVLTQAEWDELRETNYDEYIDTLTDYKAERATRRANWKAQQERVQGESRQQKLTETKATVRKAASEKYGLPDDLIARCEKIVDEQVLPRLHTSLQGDPEAYQMAMRAVLSDEMPGYYQQREQDLLAGNTDAVKRGQRVVRTERGTETPPPVESKGALTAEEKRMAKEMGVSEESYVRNKNR